MSYGFVAYLRHTDGLTKFEQLGGWTHGPLGEDVGIFLGWIPFIIGELAER